MTKLCLRLVHEQIVDFMFFSAATDCRWSGEFFSSSKKATSSAYSITSCGLDLLERSRTDESAAVRYKVKRTGEMLSRWGDPIEASNEYDSLFYADHLLHPC